MELKKSFRFCRKVFCGLALAATFAVVFPGCSNNDDDIDDLRVRVENLEGIVGTLQDMVSSGAMIKSITPLPDNSGYIIEFIGGKVEKIEIHNGTAPMIQVRQNSDGNGYSLWYNITPGYPEDGWVDTGVDLTGPAGPAGADGKDGQNGADGKDGKDGQDGVTPKIKVERNANGELTIWYNVIPGYPEDGWVDTGVNLTAPSGDSLLSGIIDNANGTVTLVLNDGKGTEYTFAKYSAVQHIEIMESDTVFASIGASTDLVFRVNPSSAWVPTGSGEAISKWMLDEFSSRSSYVNESKAFTIKSIMPDGDKTGQYIATIACNLTNLKTSAESYKMALVLDNSSSEGISEDALVSSGLFTVKPALGHGVKFTHFDGNLFQDGNFYGEDKTNYVLNFYGFDPEQQWAGWYFTLNVIAPKADYKARKLELAPGTYTLSRSGDEYTVDYYYDTSLMMYREGSPAINIVRDAEISFKEGGTITVAGSEAEGYTVDFNIPLTDGSVFTAKYTGSLEINNPYIISTFEGDQNIGEIPITLFSYFANPYPTFPSDIFLIQGYSSSIYIANDKYNGDGWVFATQISVPLGTGENLPDGEWTIANDLNPGYALCGYLDPAAQRAGTWLLRMEDGKLVGMAPVVSGKVTSECKDGNYTVTIAGKDDCGNEINGKLCGTKPAKSPKNHLMKLHGKNKVQKASKSPRKRFNRPAKTFKTR